MNHHDFLEHALLDSAKDSSEGYDPIPYRLMESEGFMYSLAFSSVIAALSSVMYSIGPLSRFLP